MLNKIFPTKHRDLAIAVFFFVSLAVLFHITTALKGCGRYRDQHLGTALHYAETKLDLKHTIIVGFNATDTPTIQELPVWQMAAGLVFKCMGTWWGWANVVSLLLFLNCLYPLFQIAKQFYGERTAWWTLVLFLSQALIFFYIGEAGTDGFAAAVSIWFWFACCRLLENPAKWFLPAAALGALTAVSKMPFFVVTGLAAFFILLNIRGFKVRDIAVLAIVGVAAGIVFFLWTRYTDAAQTGAEFPYVDLRLSNPDMVFWYFGDWHYRMDPMNWLKAAWRFANVTFGSFTLIVLFIFACVRRQTNPAAKLFLLAGILTTLVFTHLILHHYNYIMIFSPAVAILCASAMTDVECFLASHFSSRFITLSSITILLAALFQGLMTFRAFTFDVFPGRMANEISKHTTSRDKLVIINGGWGGNELILSGRRGVSVWNSKLFDDPEKYARLKQLGFSKLVILSDSPYQNAIQIVNPGQTGIPRTIAKTYLTPLVVRWPTVLETDDIIIKEIP